MSNYSELNASVDLNETVRKEPSVGESISITDISRESTDMVSQTNNIKLF